MSSICTATAADGKNCSAPAQTGKTVCFWHDPAKAKEQEEARAKGGLTRAEQLNGAIVPKLDSAEAVRDYLAQMARDVVAGLLTKEQALAISSLCKTALDAIRRAEDREEERRLGAGGDNRRN